MLLPATPRNVTAQRIIAPALSSTDEHSALECLVAPITRYFRRALREPL